MKNSGKKLIDFFGAADAFEGLSERDVEAFSLIQDFPEPYYLPTGELYFLQDELFEWLKMNGFMTHEDISYEAKLKVFAT